MGSKKRSLENMVEIKKAGSVLKKYKLLISNFFIKSSSNWIASFLPMTGTFSTSPYPLRRGTERTYPPLEGAGGG
jgi:hypothetical protein